MAKEPCRKETRMSENMNNIPVENSDEMEIDLGQLWKLIKKNMRMIIISTLMLAVAFVLFTMFFIEKKYASTTTIYLTPKVEQGYVDNTTVTSNKTMVNNYMLILQGNSVLSKVADELGLTSGAEVKKSLSVTNETDTQIIRVTAKTENATKSKQIAEATVRIFFDEMKENLNITSMTILDDAKIENAAVSPSLKKNGLMGGLIGGALSCGYIFLKYILDKRLRNRDEAEGFLGLPVLVEIPYYD